MLQYFVGSARTYGYLDWCAAAVAEAVRVVTPSLLGARGLLEKRKDETMFGTKDPRNLVFFSRVWLNMPGVMRRFPCPTPKPLLGRFLFFRVVAQLQIVLGLST